jgi:hypothetical protein
MRASPAYSIPFVSSVLIAFVSKEPIQTDIRPGRRVQLAEFRAVCDPREWTGFLTASLCNSMDFHMHVSLPYF